MGGIPNYVGGKGARFVNFKRTLTHPPKINLPICIIIYSFFAFPPVQVHCPQPWSWKAVSGCQFWGPERDCAISSQVNFNVISACGLSFVFQDIFALKTFYPYLSWISKVCNYNLWWFLLVFQNLCTSAGGKLTLQRKQMENKESFIFCAKFPFLLLLLDILWSLK